MVNPPGQADHIREVCKRMPPELVHVIEMTVIEHVKEMTVIKQSKNPETLYLFCSNIQMLIMDHFTATKEEMSCRIASISEAEAQLPQLSIS